MIVGFSQRRQFVSESDAMGFPTFTLALDVHSLRVSEIEYEAQFRALETGSATVEAVNIQFSSHSDALFGTRESEEDIIADSRELRVGSLTLSGMLNTIIINDFIPEDQLKCYEIRIFSPDVTEFRGLIIFTCNEDEDNPVNFFCIHTICIEDDDG